jgi:hypothetical protein
MLLAGDEVLATSTNPRLRTAGEPGLFVDLFVCFREAVFYAGRGKSVLMQADISSKGWDVYYYVRSAHFSCCLIDSFTVISCSSISGL